MRGRKPKPTHLKLVSGNAGKRKLNDQEPMPIGNLANPPDWLTDDQRAGWDYAIESAPRGMLKRLDKSVFVVWVVAEDLHRQASMAVAKLGLVTKHKASGEPAQNPYVPIINRQATIMIKAASELGFTPTSRSRIRVDDDEEESSEEKYFG